MIWTGHVLCGLFVLFMLGASIAPKLFLPDVSQPSMLQLGWPVHLTALVGMIELAGVILYVIPQTAVLGAVLLMALLGGAMAVQLRVGNPLFSHVLFSIYLGAFMWGGLWLRKPALRAVLPFGPA